MNPTALFTGDYVWAEIFGRPFDVAPGRALLDDEEGERFSPGRNHRCP